MFLIKKSPRKGKVAHWWNGYDTVCRMASTGGLNKKHYKVVKKTDLPICNNCKKVYVQNKIKERQ